MTVIRTASYPVGKAILPVNKIFTYTSSSYWLKTCLNSTKWFLCVYVESSTTSTKLIQTIIIAKELNNQITK
jgi:hypothetical protein